MKEKTKKIIAIASVAVIFILAVTALVYTYNEVPGTYENVVDARELLENPEDYDTSDASGIAEIIVDENLDKTNAMNDVASIVFDFRGYDTMGESFILLTAIAGTFVIISKLKKNKKSEVKEGNNE